MINNLRWIGVLGAFYVACAAVGTARLNLEYTAITAPVSGRVGLRQADIGNYLTPGDATGIRDARSRRPHVSSTRRRGYP